MGEVEQCGVDVLCVKLEAIDLEQRHVSELCDLFVATIQHEQGHRPSMSQCLDWLEKVKI